MSLWGQPILSVAFAAGYLGLISLMWLALALGVPAWGRKWRLLQDETGVPPGPVQGPLVSICVPARDEALNIGTCVRAALASDWSPLEVVVVDDRSGDGTAEVARAAAAGDPRFRLVTGSAPPPGWAGKVWACCRAAGEATGSLLVFVDADVRLAPGAVRSLTACMQAQDLALASVFGSWRLETFWERAVIPVVGWLIRGAVDLDRVNDPVRPEAFANGQLIAVRRADYDAVGGHGAVRDQILDDVRLAEAFKRRGLRVGLFDAPWLFSVRLYRSLGEIIQGYSKNLYEGMGRRPLLGLGAVLFIFVGTLFPYLALGGALVTRVLLGWAVPGWGWVLWLAVICGLQVLFRWRIERRDGRGGAIAWTHALGNLVLVWVLLRSVFGVESRWKGRRFVDGKAAT